jgi:hypothetical protein
VARFRYREPEGSNAFHAKVTHARQPRRDRRPPRRAGLGVVTPQTTAAWRDLLTPDGTPDALPYQVEYVRAAVQQETGLRPSLRGLTIGQAQRILAALNVDSRPLWHSGRDSWAMNVLAICGKWLAFVMLFIVILGLGRADGVPIVLLIMAGFGLSAMRRQRRQMFEDRHYRAIPAPRSPAAHDGGRAAKRSSSPQAPPAVGNPYDLGNPYDVDTYLRRLDDEDR